MQKDGVLHRLRVVLGIPAAPVVADGIGKDAALAVEARAGDRGGTVCSVKGPLLLLEPLLRVLSNNVDPP